MIWLNAFSGQVDSEEKEEAIDEALRLTLSSLNHLYFTGRQIKGDTGTHSTINSNKLKTTIVGNFPLFD